MSKIDYFYKNYNRGYNSAATKSSSPRGNVDKSKSSKLFTFR